MDHKSSTVDERTDFASHVASSIRDMKARGLVGEHMKLETCNRVELYIVFSGEDERNALNDLAGEAKALYDYEAVRHLIRVLLGLESMARGESHIVSQMKMAYASSDGCGKVLHRLIQRALGIAASLRSEIHPGREPSLSRIAADYYLENVKSDLPVMVTGMGEIGRETAHVLLLSGCRVYVTNRTERPLCEKLQSVVSVPWSAWKERAKECGAIFLCTSSPTPVLGARDSEAMSDIWILDLGSPYQSEPGSFGVRVTLDEMKGIADGLMEDYGKSLVMLEDEADKASSALLAEISILTDDTWKHLAMARANALIKDRASHYSRKNGVAKEDLELFASSIMKAFLHPLVAESTAHSSRTWRILSGEGAENAAE
jgi:glutamyl-tRNA reductase